MNSRNPFSAGSHIPSRGDPCSRSRRQPFCVLTLDPCCVSEERTRTVPNMKLSLDFVRKQTIACDLAERRPSSAGVGREHFDLGSPNPWRPGHPGIVARCHRQCPPIQKVPRSAAYAFKSDRDNLTKSDSVKIPTKVPFSNTTGKQVSFLSSITRHAVVSGESRR